MDPTAQPIAGTPPDPYNAPQYAAWGVIVQTSNVRAAHVANGLMQLLRLMPSPPRWTPACDLDPGAYISLVKGTLRSARFDPGLSAAARALCVYRSEAGPLRLDKAPTSDTPQALKEFVKKGREHLASILEPAGGEGNLSEEAHRAIADALNADGRVMAAGGSDPTTTGLAFAGFTDTHTLKGMHAATFLGLLCATASGREALQHFHEAAGKGNDPHASLVRLLDLVEKDGGNERAWPALESSDFQDAYPMPREEGWIALAAVAGEMASNITRRQGHGTTKAETMMSLVDLGLLLLSMRMLRWERTLPSAPRVLLAVCSPRTTTTLQQAITRAKESLRLASAALNEQAEGDGTNSLIRRKPTKKGKVNEYPPGSHALHLAAAGGWLFPFNAHGGAQQYVCPGPRQLVTLVHALTPPGGELAWAAFAAKAERAVGLALGGADDSRAEALRMGGVAATLRETAKVNQERLISLGLARRESDNVVIVDGGAR